MTDAINSRELVLEALLAINKDGEYSHVVLKNILDKYDYLSRQERSFVKRVVQGTLEHQMELDEIINQVSKVKVNKMKPVIREILRSGVYQLKYMDSVPDSAACNEAVKLAVKKGFGSLKGFVNGVMRNITRQLPQMQLPKTLSIQYSMPQWIVDCFTQQYGTEKTEDILKAFQKEQPTSIRVNETKTDREKLKQKLENQGMTVLYNPEAECGLYLSGYDSLSRIPEFQNGEFYIQDTGSMMVGITADPKQGDFCVDVCAAPGGKSMHLAERMMGTGIVSARDITPYKVALMEENRERLGLTNMETKVMDASVLDHELLEKADIVIADLPCSGLGIIGRKPDIKYKTNPDSLEELKTLQIKILDTVCQYVKAGGTLLYSTCTINKGENEENVSRFLEHHPEFVLDQEILRLPGGECYDGFYLARLKKKE